MIDNDMPSPLDTHGMFLIKDSVGSAKDTVNFDYEVGALKMTKANYGKLFSINSVYDIYLKFTHLSFRIDTTYTYETQIPNKYMNGEYPHGFMNKTYFIVKVFNKFDAYSRSKYFFKKHQNYIIQTIIPGMGTIISVRKKHLPKDRY